MPQAHPLTRLVTVTALAALTLSGCSGKDPWIGPACTHIPAAAIRAAVTDLGAVPRTGADGAENGDLPVANLDKTYRCGWPAANPDKYNSFAFKVFVRATDPDTYTQLAQDVATENGPALSSTAPGQGGSWSHNGDVGAIWLCPRRDRIYATLYLTVEVYRPAHKQNPAADAKTLAEAIVPLIGCTPGDATPTPSGPTPTGPTTAQPSPTPSH